MQELRSTEILDKEILNDAGKKAESIKKKTEKEISQIIASVDGDVEKTQKDKQAYYAEKLSLFKKDKMAAEPLEKQRMKVSFIQSSIASKINAYFCSLPEKKQLELVLSQLPSDIITSGEKKLTAYIYGFSFEAAKKSLQKNIRILSAVISRLFLASLYRKKLILWKKIILGVLFLNLKIKITDID